MKLEPLMVTSVPTGPVLGLIGLIAALAVTVNCSVSVPVPAVTVMVWGPAVAVVGMVIVLRNRPPLVVEVCPLFGVNVVVSNLKIRAVLVGKFDPLTITSVPAMPVAGESGSRVGLAVMVKAGDFPSMVG
jgi:hypothetical protein